MVRMGYSPSVRLFEAAACGSPIISDWWPGLNTIFMPGRHILVAKSGKATCSSYLHDLPDEERRQLATRAREHVLGHHTAAHRARALENYVEEVGVGTAARTALPLQAERMVIAMKLVIFGSGRQFIMGKWPRGPMARPDPRICQTRALGRVFRT